MVGGIQIWRHGRGEDREGRPCLPPDFQQWPPAESTRRRTFKDAACARGFFAQGGPRARAEPGKLGTVPPLSRTVGLAVPWKGRVGPRTAITLLLHVVPHGQNDAGETVRKRALVLHRPSGAGSLCLRSPTESRVWGPCLDAATSRGCIDDHPSCAYSHTAPPMFFHVLQAVFHSSSSVGCTSMEVMRNAVANVSAGWWAMTLREN